LTYILCMPKPNCGSANSHCYENDCMYWLHTPGRKALLRVASSLGNVRHLHHRRARPVLKRQDAGVSSTFWHLHEAEKPKLHYQMLSRKKQAARRPCDRKCDEEPEMHEQCCPTTNHPRTIIKSSYQ
jgi:hypothetical protein